MASDLNVWEVTVRCGDYIADAGTETYCVVAGKAMRAETLAKRACRERDGWEVAEAVLVKFVARCDGVEGLPDGE